MKMKQRQQLFFFFFVFLLFYFSPLLSESEPVFSYNEFQAENITAASNHGVQLQIRGKHVVIGNGILEVTLANPEGSVTGIQYNEITNLLEFRDEEDKRGYWDIVWNVAGSTGTKGMLDRMEATKMKVVIQNEKQVELSFTRMWNASLEGKIIPLNIDKRFVMLRGSSGFYSYATYERLKGWPAFNLDNTRIAFKLRKDKFKYMAISNNRQRHMPLPDDRLPPRGQVLAYPEAVLLVDPVEPDFRDEVDDKYQYSCENKDLRVHGWMSIDHDPSAVGFWVITPSDEFRSGGPLKQSLGSHVGPTSLSVFHSAHYAGEDMILKFGDDESWKKVYGPVFIYLNSLSDAVADPLGLWDDAKRQMVTEVQSWPYVFPASLDFPKSNQRGRLSGRLLVRDPYLNVRPLPVSGSFVGLAPLGVAGSWQTECKGYQFWTRTDEQGYFTISNIRVGNYSLNGWVDGFLGDYQHNDVIMVTPDNEINIGELIYEPPRDGSTLWEIGIPDRSAAEFYIPDPNPSYINKLYVNDSNDRFRQYGLWERYADLYPNGDLIYTIDLSDYTKDWFFAQVTRKVGDNRYKGTTWQIKFRLDYVNRLGIYRLRLALATAQAAELQVRVNNEDQANPPLFSTGVIGRDNTIARHGIHGLYRLYTVAIPGSQLLDLAENTIFLTQTESKSPFQGVMYDYIRLEGPSSVNFGS